MIGASRVACLASLLAVAGCGCGGEGTPKSTRQRVPAGCQLSVFLHGQGAARSVTSLTQLGTAPVMAVGYGDGQVVLYGINTDGSLNAIGEKTRGQGPVLVYGSTERNPVEYEYVYATHTMTVRVPQDKTARMTWVDPDGWSVLCPPPPQAQSQPQPVGPGPGAQPLPGIPGAPSAPQPGAPGAQPQPGSPSPAPQPGPAVPPRTGSLLGNRERNAT
jgi:hypothetical protein